MITTQSKSNLIFSATRLNSQSTFAFTNSKYLIDYNLSLLRQSNYELISSIDFTEVQKIHFLNYGKYIIVLKIGKTLEDQEQFFIDYRLPNNRLKLMNEIFNPQQLGVILALKQKMVESYTEADELVASIVCTFN